MPSQSVSLLKAKVGLYVSSVGFPGRSISSSQGSHLKQSFAVATLLLLALGSQAQVKITAFTPNGRLDWTNQTDWIFLPSFGFTGPVYRIDSARLPNGPWTILTNTSETSLSLTNLQPPDREPTFYRVAWTNGQVWSYEGYYGENLIVTGKLYFNIALYANNPVIYGGSWNLARTGAPGGDWHPFGIGGLLPLCENVEEDCFYTVCLNPYTSDDNFSLLAPDPRSDSWTGTWSWSGFAGPAQHGTFALQKIRDGP